MHCIRTGICIYTWEKYDILKRWVEHFSNLLNRPSTVHQDSTDAIEQRPITEHLAEPQRKQEVSNAINCFQTGKAAGEDGLPAEIFKYGGQALLDRLHDLFLLMLQSENIPDQLKDAVFVTIYKRKGDSRDCNKHRGTLLLAIASKILTKIMQYWFVTSILDDIVSELQCDFRSNHGTSIWFLPLDSYKRNAWSTTSVSIWSSLTLLKVLTSSPTKVSGKY